MRSTGSEPGDAGRYPFSFAWQSPYGHAVRLVERIADPPGIVLDLGCGFGAVAEPLTTLGFAYIGVDINSQSLADLEARGFRAHRLDLTTPQLAAELTRLVGSERVSAILLLDVLEHLARPAEFLLRLRHACRLLAADRLVLSVPNVAHIDVAAKLLLGRFDVTETGLLDRTHLQHFTESRLTSELGQAGWVELARDDFVLARSDQHFPEHHPALAEGSTLRRFMLDVRRGGDGSALVNQFVRAYGLLVAGTTPEETAPVERPFLSVILRTEGRRPDCLMNALTCLAAQSDDDFEVILTVHTPAHGTFAAVEEMVALFEDRFRLRVTVIHVIGGGRSRPLNEGLAHARGHYVAFLDDDDLVLGNWVEVFKREANTSPGSVIRTRVVTRTVRRTTPPEMACAYVAESWVRPEFVAPFDLIEHLHVNRTPICAFAAPVEALRSLGIRFTDDLSVQEDWDFLLQAASVAGVRDAPRVTSIYHRWRQEGSIHTVRRSLWEATREVIIDRLDRRPLLLPEGSASRIARALDERNRLQKELDTVNSRHSRTIERLQELESRLQEKTAALDRVHSSRSWQVTAPLRFVAALVRRR